jgi:DNA-binding NarL/FixJ family response regulator
VRTPIRTIVVDDYEPWCQFLRQTLLAAQDLHVIGQCSDGPEAIQKAKELQPDLILLDIGLPTLNGIEVARRLREICPKTKILFVSENRSVEVAEAALRTGDGVYLLKSDAARDLFPAIQAILDGKRFISETLSGQLVLATSTLAQMISCLGTLF